MLPIATSTDSTYATTLVAFGVTETVMIVSTDFLSAPALSTPAKFWPLRLRKPPTALSAGRGISSCMRAALIWPSSFAVCVLLQFALQRLMLKLRISLVVRMAAGHCWSLLALGWFVGPGMAGLCRVSCPILFCLFSIFVGLSFLLWLMVWCFFFFPFSFLLY